MQEVSKCDSTCPLLKMLLKDRSSLGRETLTAPCHGRYFPRPIFREVNVASIVTLYPELAGVDPGFIRDNLPNFAGLSMLPFSRHLQRNKAADTTGETTLSIPPSHILAIYPRPPVSNKSQEPILYPIHDLVFAANCTRFPAASSSLALSPFLLSCPPAATSPPAATRKSPRLWTIPVALGSPSSFPILLEYLYTKDHKRLLGNLVRPSSGESLESWSAFIRGFWENAVALGVVDIKLYDVIDDAWEIYLRFSALERPVEAVSCHTGTGRPGDD